MKVNDKVAIVTGASSGIGFATAKLLTEKGAKVALVSRSHKKLIEISQKLPNSFVVVADISKGEEVKEMIEKVREHYGRIDILVNNAGQGYDAPIEKIDIDTFQKVLNLDLVGPLIAMQEVISVMRNQGEGAIINISSGTALMSIPYMGAYSSLKRALVGLSLTARQELAEENIHVGVVYPYITNTDFEKNTIKEALSNDSDEGEGPPFPADPPEYVAQKILEAIETEKAEIFAHDWMKPKNK